MKKFGLVTIAIVCICGGTTLYVERLKPSLLPYQYCLAVPSPFTIEASPHERRLKNDTLSVPGG